MNSTNAFLVGRIRGIPIRIHVTFLIVLPFLAYSFGHGFVEAARLAVMKPTTRPASTTGSASFAPASATLAGRTACCSASPAE